MIMYYEKYDVMGYGAGYPTDVRHAQVACLYWKFNKDIDAIVDISGYVKNTVKQYIEKYKEEVKEYDVFFNPSTPPKAIRLCSSVPMFKDDYDHVTPQQECGLYLIGSTYFDPEDENKKYYWIKVGMSSNLKQRLKGYSTENPMYWLADTLICDSDIVTKMEYECHIALSDIAYGMAKNTNEWFLVTKEQYLTICKQGFHYFFDY